MKIKPLSRALLLLSLTPQLISPVNPANLTGDTGAILTDVHNKVDKRQKIDWERQVWGDIEPGKLGDLLSEGTQVGTGNRSWAQISWPQVTTRIWEESVIAIAPNKRIVHLLDGEMLFNLDKNHKVGDKCEVWTKLLSARVHGTTFIVQSTADFSRVTVLEGNLDVTNRLDKSVVNIGPGVVYEVRTGAAPPATWVKPESSPFENQQSNLRGLQFDRPQFGGNQFQPRSSSGFQSNTPKTAYDYNPSNRAPGQLKYSEQEIQAKADEMSRANPSKRQYILQMLRQKNIEETAKEDRYIAMRQQQQEQQQFQKQQLQEQYQQKQFMAQQNQFKPGFKPGLQDKGLRDYQTSLPFIDTSEFAPIKTEQTKKTSSSGETSKFPKKSHFVQDISSHAVPPISLFRTASSATNLYLADVNQIWKHQLIHGYSKKLGSLDLVQKDLFSLPEICRQQAYFSRNSDFISKRNEVISSSAHVLQAPGDKVQQVGREMANSLTLPGQTPATKQGKEAG